MAKLKTDPITEADIAEYLDKNSDFSFEIKTVKLLADLGYKCLHSGTYTDPVTGKTREFDIRVFKNKKLSSALTLNFMAAIECKNLKEHFPLVVQCLSRSKHDVEDMIFCYHNEVAQMMIDDRMTKFVAGKYPFNAYAVPLHYCISLYTKGLPVGKSCDQVGRNTSNEVTGSDSDVFEKISQAINSSFDLIQDAARCESSTQYTITAIKPILVIPDGMLWRILYDEDGNIVEGPVQTNFVPYYYGKTWPYKDWDAEKEFTLKHLDIVTFSYLPEHIEKVFRIEKADIIDHLKDLQQSRVLPEEVRL